MPFPHISELMAVEILNIIGMPLLVVLIFDIAHFYMEYFNDSGGARMQEIVEMPLTNTVDIFGIIKSLLFHIKNYHCNNTIDLR